MSLRDEVPAAGLRRVEGEVLLRGLVRPAVGVPLRFERVGHAEGQDVSTDAEGRFTVDLPPGRHAVHIDDAALLPFETVIEVPESTDGGSFPLVLRVTPRLGVDADAQVVGARGGAETSLTLDRVEATRVAGTMGDPLKVIQSLPGVGSMASLLPYPVVRGAAPGDTAYLVDGTVLPMLFHVGIGNSVVHPRLVDRVDFFPGVAPIRYGRYTGGAVEAITRPPEGEQTLTDIDVNLLQAGALVSVPLNDGRTRITAAGRYSYSGLLISQLNEGTELGFWDYHLRLDQDLPGAGHHLKLAIFGAEDQFGDQRQVTEVGFHRLTARHQIALGADDSLQSQLDLGRDRADSPFSTLLYVRDPTCTPATCDQSGFGRDLYLPENRIEHQLIAEWVVRGRVAWDHWFGDDLRLSSGIDYELRRAVDDLAITRNASLIGFAGEHLTRHVWGAYTGATWSPLPTLRILPGVRTDVYARQGWTVGVDPRLGAELDLSAATTLRAQVGLSHAPQRFFLPIPGLSDVERDVDLVEAWQAAVGVSHRIADAWTLSATAYGTLQRNLLALDDAGYLSGDELPFDVSVDENPVSYQTGNMAFSQGRGAGLEVLLRRERRGRWFGWLAATLQHHERQRPDGQWRPSPLDQAVVLNAVSTWQLTAGWSAGFRMHLHTGRPVEGSGGIVDSPRQRPEGRLPAYYQLDLRTDWVWVHDGAIIDLYLDVINATFNREVTGVDGDGERTSRYIIPTLGLHITF